MLSDIRGTSTSNAKKCPTASKRNRLNIEPEKSAKGPDDSDTV